MSRLLAEVSVNIPAADWLPAGTDADPRGRFAAFRVRDDATMGQVADTKDP
jgi:hypothetical protein